MNCRRHAGGIAVYIWAVPTIDNARPLRILRIMAARGKSVAFTRIRTEVVRLVGLIPTGKFTTYGSIAIHMNVIARHVATVLSHLTPEESAALPWHRVVSANARLSPNMGTKLSAKQRRLLKAEGLLIDKDGFIQDADAHFYNVGVRRDIRWSEG